MRFLARWLANGLAVFLGLYLFDSLVHERFHLEATYPAVLAAVFLGLANSFVRPLHRARSRPVQAAVAAVLTLLGNFLFLHIFVWAQAALSTTSFAWVIVAAAFITLLTGLINWLIGFPSKERPRPAVMVRDEESTTGRRDKAAPRSPVGPKAR